jgi:hypothetical protein
MATTPGQHPNELSGIVVDTPPRQTPALERLESPGLLKTASAHRLVRCTNLRTGAFLGWLATYANNVYLETDPNSSSRARCEFASYSYHIGRAVEGPHPYLCIETSPGSSDRMLGLGSNSYACWGIISAGGWKDPIIYNDDHTISIQAAPNRKLYGPYGNQWVRWSEGNHEDIMKCDLEP